MLSQLLDEPYIKFNLIRQVKLGFKRGFHHEELDPQSVASFLLRDRPWVKIFTYKNKRVETQEDFLKALENFRLEDVESSLLERVAFESVGRDWDQTNWEKLSFSEKLEIAKIPEYAGDRNINDLIMYIDFLENSNT